MEYWIVCDGLPIGTARIAPFAGLAHGELQPVPGYERIRHHAVAAGHRLLDAGFWSSVNGDFAEEFARAWEGGRLALTDHFGNELAVASVVIIDWEHTGNRPPARVVVDVRPDMARIEAFLRTMRPSGDDRSRPAA